MTEKVKEEKKVAEKPKKPIWSAEDKKLAVNYGCQLIVDDANSEQLLDRKLPTDTMIGSYTAEGKSHNDLVRGSQVNIFDLYYDKFGKDGIQKIDYGPGTINPGQWGYKAPEKKRRRKG